MDNRLNIIPEKIHPRFVSKLGNDFLERNSLNDWWENFGKENKKTPPPEITKLQSEYIRHKESGRPFAMESDYFEAEPREEGSLSYRSAVKTSEGWKIRKDLSEDKINDYLFGFGRGANHPEQSFVVGINLQNQSHSSQRETECGFVVEMFDSNDSLEIYRENDDGTYRKANLNAGKNRNEFFYGNKIYSNSYAIRGKIKDLEKCLLSGKIKAIHLVEKNPKVVLN